jgi:hypothetical protein
MYRYSKRRGKHGKSHSDHRDSTVEPWRDGLLKLGLPAHLVHHLATMADLHRGTLQPDVSHDVPTLKGGLTSANARMQTDLTSI